VTRLLQRAQRLLDGRSGQLVRGVLGAFALAWIVFYIDLRVALASLRALPISYAIGAILGFFVSSAFASVRWALLLEDAGLPRPTLFEALRTTLEGTFVGLLPTGLAGDVVRATSVPITSGVGSSLVGVLVTDRLAGLAGLMLVSALAVVAKAATSHSAPSRVEWLLAAMGAVVVVGAAAVQAWATTTAPSPSAVRTFGRRAAVHMALSLGTQGSSSIAIAVLVHSLHEVPSVVDVVIRAPFVILGTIAPITPASVGQRDLVFAAVYRDLGLTKESAVAASLAWLACGLFVAAAGAASLVRRRTTARTNRNDVGKP
jgi:uncharacterized membrane protein YbhN (UPF0104 family)